MKIVKRLKIKPKDNKIIINLPPHLEGKNLLITIEQPTNKRTNLQNRSLHLYFTQLAEALNDAGYDMKKVIKPDVDISWSPMSVKEYLWRPIQKVNLQKKSTTKLNTEEVDIVYNILNKVIAERTGIHVPWPSIEEMFNRE